jgi:hypothetical protein
MENVLSVLVSLKILSFLTTIFIMCFYETPEEKYNRQVTKLCMSLHIHNAVNIFTQTFPGHKLILDIRGVNKDLYKQMYKTYCKEFVGDYGSNSCSVLFIHDGVVVEITTK